MKQRANLPPAVGLDIGSQYVRCVVGQHESDNPAPSIIGVGEARCEGVRRGVVADVEETVSAISAAIDEAERVGGIHLTQASVGINGSHILTIGSHGVIALGPSPRDITEQDVARVEEAATIMQLPPNREIVQAFPRNYQIDGQEHIKDPVGMNGLRLEVDTSLITAAAPFIKNLDRAVHQAGLSVDNHIANPLSAATVLINKNLRELGSLVVDVGASTTGIAIFEEGELLHVAILPVGAHHITNDLAIGLRTDIETAEKVKLEHATVTPKRIPGERNLKIKEQSGQDLVASQREINNIARARAEEILEVVNRELKKVKREGLLPGGVVLAGGGAKMAGFEDLAKHILRLPAQIGRPKNFSGIVDKVNDPSYACALGLMVENAQIEHHLSALNITLGILSSGKGIIQGLWRRFRP